MSQLTGGSNRCREFCRSEKEFIQKYLKLLSYRVNHGEIREKRVKVWKNEKHIFVFIFSKDQ